MDPLTEIIFQENFLSEINKIHPERFNYSLYGDSTIPIENHYFVISTSNENIFFYYKLGKSSDINCVKYSVGDLCIYQMSKKMSEFDIYIIEKIEKKHVYLWNGFWNFECMFDTREKLYENQEKSLLKVIIKKFLKFNFTLQENFDHKSFVRYKILKLTKRKTFQKLLIHKDIKKSIYSLLSEKTS